MRVICIEPEYVSLHSVSIFYSLIALFLIITVMYFELSPCLEILNCQVRMKYLLNLGQNYTLICLQLQLHMHIYINICVTNDTIM